jgi:hypothetical protein
MTKKEDAMRDGALAVNRRDKMTGIRGNLHGPVRRFAACAAATGQTKPQEQEVASPKIAPPPPRCGCISNVPKGGRQPVTGRGFEILCMASHKCTF